MIKVLTVGVFDLLHIGHINLIKKAKELGDYLIVAVQSSEYVTRFKPKARLVYSTEERIAIIKALKYVDEVIEYECIDLIIHSIEFDILAVGPDQQHDGFQRAFEWCKSNGKQIIIIPRTEGISSSSLKEQIRII